MLNQRKYIFLFIISFVFFFLGFSTVWIDRYHTLEQKEDRISFLNSSKIIDPSKKKLKSKEKEKARQKILKEFGDELEFKFTDETESLISIHGGKIALLKKDPQFDIQNIESIKKRAKNVLTLMRPLLNYNPGYPLDQGKVTVGERSASVVFTQTSEDIPFHQVGKVSISFATKGEIVSVFSDYIHKLALLNEYDLKPDEAKRKLSGLIEGDVSLEQISFGKKVIWVSGVEGYRAYEFKYKNTIYIVHGQTARILIAKEL